MCVFFFWNFCCKILDASFSSAISSLRASDWEGTLAITSSVPMTWKCGTYEPGAANLEDILDSEDGGASWLFRLFGRRMTSFQAFHDRSKVAVCTARNGHGVSSIVALYTVMLYTNVRNHTHTNKHLSNTLKKLPYILGKTSKPHRQEKHETHSKALKKSCMVQSTKHPRNSSNFG